MKDRHLGKVSLLVPALAVAIGLAAAAGDAAVAAAPSDAPNVRVFRGIEDHPNYRGAARLGVRVVRGKPNAPRAAPAPPGRAGAPAAMSLVPGTWFLAGPGARAPYPYWPPWRQTRIPTHCAPRWMC